MVVMDLVASPADRSDAVGAAWCRQRLAEGVVKKQQMQGLSSLTPARPQTPFARDGICQ
jgi:hypothetical protein